MMANSKRCRQAAHDIKIRCLAVLMLLLTAAANADAAEPARWYEVELIVFAYTDPQALEAEQWPLLEGIELPRDSLVALRLPSDAPLAQSDDNLPAVGLRSAAAASAPAPDMPAAYEILPADSLRLNAAYQHLSRSAKTTPLLHVAWRQPTLDEQHAPPVLLQDGMTEPLHAPSAADAASDTAFVGPISPRLIGTVRVSVARYLHLAADLVYRQRVTQRAAEPVSDLELWYDRPYPTLNEPQGPAYRLHQWQAIRGFEMQESRRMRSTKLHYLDHPMFGLLAVITPVQLPEATKAVGQSDGMQDDEGPTPH